MIKKNENPEVRSDGSKVQCEHCQSNKTTKETGYAIVQEKSKETGIPIGEKILIHFYRCLACGEQLYIEVKNGLVN